MIRHSPVSRYAAQRTVHFAHAELVASSEIALDDGERPTSLSLVQIGDAGVQHFALGTTFEDRPDDAGASNSGYLRIISVKVDESSGRPPSAEVVASKQMNGTVYDVKVIWGALAVAVDHRVSIRVANGTVALH